MFDVVEKALSAKCGFAGKDEARKFFNGLRQTFIDWNDKPFDSAEFASLRESLLAKIAACN